MSKNSRGAVLFLYFAFLCFAIAAFGVSWTLGFFVVGLECLVFCLGFELQRRDEARKREPGEVEGKAP